MNAGARRAILVDRKPPGFPGNRRASSARDEPKPPTRLTRRIRVGKAQAAYCGRPSRGGVLLKNMAQRRAAWGDWVASKRAKLAAMSGSKIAMPTQPLLSMPAGAGATASDKTRSGTNLTGECTGTLSRYSDWAQGFSGLVRSVASRCCGLLEERVEELLMPGNDPSARDGVAYRLTRPQAPSAVLRALLTALI
jgi:hypothetical protein